MSQRKTKIVLNGKTYDVKSGKKLDSQPAPPVKQNPPTAQKQIKSIDGFVSKPKPIVIKKPTKTRHLQTSPNRQMNSHQPNRNIHHAKRRKQEKSHTLMRTVVSPPNLVKSNSKENAENKLILPDQKSRLERAKKIQKSPVISRFPASYQTAENFTKPAEGNSKQSLELVEAPKLQHHSEKQKHGTEQKNPKTKQEQVFEKAMSASESHKQTVSKKYRKARTNKNTYIRNNYKWATGVLSALLLFGFILYQNVPNLSMRIASSKAGIDASLPGYSPDGYSLSGPVVYSPGKVSINFSSNSDNRSYTLSQQVSNWNSQALTDNYLNNTSSDYQSFQEKGKTIYVYGDNNATWVSGGVWYDLKGGTGLNTDQLLKIAASI